MGMHKVTPLNGRVLIEQSEAERTTENGIYIPDTALVKPSKGTITQVSDDVAKHLVKGAKVMFGKQAGIEVEIDGKPYLFMHQSEIFLTYEEQA